MPGLMKSALCYKYTYPIGMLNFMLSGGYDFCSEDKENIGKCEDVLNCDNLNQSIATILKQHFTSSSTSQSSNQTITYGTNISFDSTPDEIQAYKNQYQSGESPGYMKSWKKMKELDDEFGCSANIEQIAMLSTSTVRDISDDIAKEMLNKINSRVDEHLSENGFSDEGIKVSAKSRLANHSALISHIKTKTKSIITQSQVGKQSITYIDNYRKCGKDKQGNPIGPHISESITFKSVSKNIVKSTIQQMMKNDTNLKISSKVSISKTSDRIMFFSLIFNILFVYFTFKLFSSEQKIYMKFLIYFSSLVITFILLYISKNNLI